MEKIVVDINVKNKNNNCKHYEEKKGLFLGRDKNNKSKKGS